MSILTLANAEWVSNEARGALAVIGSRQVLAVGVNTTHGRRADVFHTLVDVPASSRGLVADVAALAHAHVGAEGHVLHALLAGGARRRGAAVVGGLRGHAARGEPIALEA